MGKPITRDKKYVKWIRTQPCLVCFKTPSQAHHYRTAENSGMGIKPADEWCVPLCHAHHSELHKTGIKTFSGKYGVDFREELTRLKGQRYVDRKREVDTLPLSQKEYEAEIFKITDELGV